MAKLSSAGFDATSVVYQILQPAVRLLDNLKHVKHTYMDNLEESIKQPESVVRIDRIVKRKIANRATLPAIRTSLEGKVLSIKRSQEAIGREMAKIFSLLEQTEALTIVTEHLEDAAAEK
jgi:hypothetical protein